MKRIPGARVTDAFLRNWLKILLTIFTIALWVLMFAAPDDRVASGQVIPDSQVARLWHDGDQLSQEVVACLGKDRIGPTRPTRRRAAKPADPPVLGLTCWRSGCDEGV